MVGTVPQPFRGELFVRLAWSAREQDLRHVVGHIRETTRIVAQLDRVFERPMVVVDPDNGRRSPLSQQSDADVVDTLQRGVARNNDGSPLPVDGYTLKLETEDEGPVAVLLRVGNTREQFGVGNVVTITMGHPLSPEQLDTGILLSDRAQAALVELIEIWQPERAGVYLAEAEDEFYDADLDEELGLVTYLRDRRLLSDDDIESTPMGSGCLVRLRGIAELGLNDLVDRVIRASRTVSTQ